jgi:hypothetical protein
MRARRWPRVAPSRETPEALSRCSGAKRGTMPGDAIHPTGVTGGTHRRLLGLVTAVLLAAGGWAMLGGARAPEAAAEPEASSAAPRGPQAAPDRATWRAEIEAERAELAALRLERTRLEEELAQLSLDLRERRAALETVRTQLAARPPATAEPAPRSTRVFVHHRANWRNGPATAEEVAQTARGGGFEVAAIRAAPYVPSTPVVRFFHDDDQAAAARLAARLGRGWAIQDFRAYQPLPAPQTLEVWLPAN